MMHFRKFHRRHSMSIKYYTGITWAELPCLYEGLLNFDIEPFEESFSPDGMVETRAGGGWGHDDNNIIIYTAISVNEVRAYAGLNIWARQFLDIKSMHDRIDKGSSKLRYRWGLSGPLAGAVDVMLLLYVEERHYSPLTAKFQMPFHTRAEAPRWVYTNMPRLHHSDASFILHFYASRE